MNINKKSRLAIVLIAALASASQVYGLQKHDPQFQAQPNYMPAPGPDPDMVKFLRNQNGSPKARPDWCAKNVVRVRETRDLVAEFSKQSGSPHTKKDPSLIPPR